MIWITCYLTSRVFSSAMRVYFLSPFFFRQPISHGPNRGEIPNTFDHGFVRACLNSSFLERGGKGMVSSSMVCGIHQTCWACATPVEWATVSENWGWWMNERWKLSNIYIVVTHKSAVGLHFLVAVHANYENPGIISAMENHTERSMYSLNEVEVSVRKSSDEMFDFQANHVWFPPGGAPELCSLAEKKNMK